MLGFLLSNQGLTMNKIMLTTVAAAISLTLSACYQDDGTVLAPNQAPPVPPTPSTLDVSGSGIKGVLANALVEVFDSSDLETALANTQTDENGDYTLSLTDASGEAITGTFFVNVSADEDTTMICDATVCGDVVRGGVVPASQLAGLKLSTMSNSDGSGTISAEVNALTTLATETILAVIEDDADIDLSDPEIFEAFQVDASRVIGATLGLDLSETNIFDVVIVDASVSANVSTDDMVAATLTLINGSLSGLEPGTDETLADAIETYITAVKLVTKAIINNPGAALDADTVAAMASINAVQAQVSQAIIDLASVISGDTGNAVGIVNIPDVINPDDIAASVDLDDEITGGTGGTGGN
jgi:hypothetical protein